MNTFHERFKNHAIHKDLELLNSIIATNVFPSQIDPVHADTFYRLVVVVKKFNAFVDSLDANLVTKEYLNSLREQLPQMASQLDAFFKNSQVQNLVAANQLADQLVLKFPMYPTPKGGKALLEAAAVYSNHSAAILKSMDEAQCELTDKIDEATKRATVISASLDALEKSINSQKQRLDSAIADFQSQFMRAETERSEQWLAAQRANKNELATDRQTTQDQIRASISELKSDAKAILDPIILEGKNTLEEMSLLKKQAADLLEITSNITITGDYDKRAKEEANSAATWRWIALSFLVLLVVVSSVILWRSFKATQIEWQLVLFRYLTAAIFALPAIYAMAESSQHRKKGDKYRKMQLELASFDPFLGSLKPEDRQNLKKDMATRVFGQPESIPNRKAGTYDARRILKMLSRIIERAYRKEQ